MFQLILNAILDLFVNVVLMDFFSVIIFASVFVIAVTFILNLGNIKRI